MSKIKPGLNTANENGARNINVAKEKKDSFYDDFIGDSGLRYKVYCIAGNPIPLARPRFSKHTSTVWDSQKEEKLFFGLHLARQHGDLPLFAGPLFLRVVFYMGIPRARQRHKLDGRLHQIRPDLSNMIKFIEDIATGICYRDDAQIAEISSRKEYSENPRIEFMLKELL